MHFSWAGQSLLLRCHIQPNARANGFCGLHGDRLKVRLKAPPVDGKANRELECFIADAFGVTRTDVVIVRGDSSRQKDLRITQPNTLPPHSLVEPQ